MSKEIDIKKVQDEAVQKASKLPEPQTAFSLYNLAMLFIISPEVAVQALASMPSLCSTIGAWILLRLKKSGKQSNGTNLSSLREAFEDIQPHGECKCPRCVALRMGAE